MFTQHNYPSVFSATTTFGWVGNCDLIMQIAVSDRFQAVPNGYLNNVSNMNAQIAVPKCTINVIQDG